MKGTLEDRVVQPLPHPLPQMGGGLELMLLIDSGYEKPKKTRIFKKKDSLIDLLTYFIGR